MISPGFSCRSAQVPEAVMGSVYLDYDGDVSEKSADSEQLTLLAQRVIRAIVEKKKDVLMQQIHSSGAYIDVKAEATPDKVAESLHEGGLLNRVYWQGSGDMKPFSELFAEAEKIEIDIFYYTPGQAELLLKFKDKPKAVINNMIYHLIDERWYLKRLP